VPHLVLALISVSATKLAGVWKVAPDRGVADLAGQKRLLASTAAGVGHGERKPGEHFGRCTTGSEPVKCAHSGIK
jgi:hypothetical protein